jgi:hypothetical protein
MAKLDLSKYVTVQDRIDYFWEQHPEGQIITELACSADNNAWIRFKASVFKSRDSVRPDATGYSQEERDYEQAVSKTGAKYDTVNSTSWEENCETSAIGRALANMGYATTVDRPSFEEMTKVMRAKVEGNTTLRTIENQVVESLTKANTQALKDKFPAPGATPAPAVETTNQRADPTTGEMMTLPNAVARTPTSWTEYVWDAGEEKAIVDEIAGYGTNLTAWKTGIFNAMKEKDEARKEGLWGFLMGGAPDLETLNKLLKAAKDTKSDTQRTVDAYTDRLNELTTEVPF